MTVPIAHGYPDWGRFEAGADKLLDKQAILGGASTVYGPYFVGDVTHVGIQFLAITHKWRVVARFFDSAALTNFIAEQSFSLHDGDKFNRSFPALGPFMTLNVTIDSGNGNYSFSVTTAHTAWQSNGQAPNAPILFSAAAIVHPVGDFFLNGLFIMPGWASFIGLATAAATFLELRAVDETGVAFPLARINNNDGTVTRLLFLPAMHIQLWVHNASAAPQLFDYSVTVKTEGLG